MNLKLLSGFLSIAQATKSLNFVSTGAKFNVTLTCQKPDSNCEGIRHTFELVTGFIENALLLEGQINVKVEFLKSIGDTSGRQPQKLGEGHSFLTCKDYGEVSFIVPDAVLRQDGQKRATDGSPDIVMTINTAVKFYFPSMFGSAQKSTQSSAIDIIAHEMLHGMGFISAIHKRPGDNHLSPYVKIKNDIEGGKNMLLKPSIFDKYVYNNNNETIAQLVSGMNPGKAEYAKDEPILPSSHFLDTMEKIETSATMRDGLYCKLKTEKVYLETGTSTFVQGSSISHLDFRYKITNDMLMVKSSAMGHGVHERANNTYWPTSPFGNRTLGILEAIGYKLNHQPSFEKSLSGYLDIFHKKITPIPPKSHTPNPAKPHTPNPAKSQVLSCVNCAFSKASSQFYFEMAFFVLGLLNH
ncbi:hypothetical protein DSO57_1005835 [Entomophthora muscae]|uniref:Uncharacterized protein n=1 Tax=Entomophthora muscae TaxID=34485 RepID=A0ACC2UHQ0_9FUNG|nr:hypothetical protein DSO57_1005835 [Entomophthora muscae]